jgi:hypothetical protein
MAKAVIRSGKPGRTVVVVTSEQKADAARAAMKSGKVIVRKLTPGQRRAVKHVANINDEMLNGDIITVKSS